MSACTIMTPTAPGHTTSWQNTHLGGFQGLPPLARADMTEFTSGSPSPATSWNPEQVSPNELEHSVVPPPTSSTGSGWTTGGAAFVQAASDITTTFLASPPAPSSSTSIAGEGAMARYWCVRGPPGPQEHQRNSPQSSSTRPCGRTDGQMFFQQRNKICRTEPTDW